MTWFLMAAVVLGWPLYSAWAWPLKKEDLERGDAEVRRRITLSTIARQWAIVAVVGISWFAEGRPVEALRLSHVPEGMQWLAVGAAMAVGAWVARMSLQGARSPEAREAARAAVDAALLALMPQSPADHVRFVALSVTAGVCEEILYRGVLWALLLPHVGVVPALVFTSAAFGAAHLYQGPSGVLKTGVVGAVLGGFAWASGSLWVAVVLHALVDIVQGQLLSAAARET